MKVYLTILVALTIVSVQSIKILHQGYPVACEPAHYQLSSLSTLGVQDDLNCTFANLGGQIKINNRSKAGVSENYIFTFPNKPYLSYRFQNEQMDIVGNNTIILYGGFVNVFLYFNWSGSPFHRGQCRASSKILEVTISKQIRKQNYDEYNYYLVSFENVVLQPFQFSNCFPSALDNEQKVLFSQVFNNLTEGVSVKSQLEQKINEKMKSQLNQCLKADSYPLTPYFTYSWSSREGSFENSMTFTRRPHQIDIQRDGVRNAFDVHLNSSKDWICTMKRVVPDKPLSPLSQYGIPQQFVGFDFLQNMLRYAIERNFFDTTLTQQYWSSSLFHFFAGNLYEVFPKLKERYTPTALVSGYCNASLGLSFLQRLSSKAITVGTIHKCKLLIKEDPISSFQISLGWNVELNPTYQDIKLKLLELKQNSTFFIEGDYKIGNQTLAKEMLSMSVERAKEVNLYGTGFPFYHRYKRTPQILVENQYLVTYEDPQGMEADFEEEQSSKEEYQMYLGFGTFTK